MSEVEAKPEETAPAAAAAPRGRRRGGGGEKTCYNCGKVRPHNASIPVISPGIDSSWLTPFILCFLQSALFRRVTLLETATILVLKAMPGRLSTRPVLSIGVASTAAKWVTSLPTVPNLRAIRLATIAAKMATLQRIAPTPGSPPPPPPSRPKRKAILGRALKVSASLLQLFVTIVLLLLTSNLLGQRLGNKNRFGTCTLVKTRSICKH
jgi:hypothetical protein